MAPAAPAVATGIGARTRKFGCHHMANVCASPRALEASGRARGGRGGRAASRTMDRGCIEDRKSETDGVYHPMVAVSKPARDSPSAGGEATKNGVACMLLLLLLLCALMIARVCGCVEGEMAGDTESTIAELLSSWCCVRDGGRGRPSCKALRAIFRPCAGFKRSVSATTLFKRCAADWLDLYSRD